MINVGEVKRSADLVDATDLAAGVPSLGELTSHRGVLGLHQDVKGPSITGHDSTLELEHNEKRNDFLWLLYYNDTPPTPLSRGEGQKVSQDSQAVFEHGLGHGSGVLVNFLQPLVNMF